MHTDITLEIMDNVTSLLGRKLRGFRNGTCTAFHTRELKKEADARTRRQATRKQYQPQVSSNGNAHQVPSLEPSGDPKTTGQPSASGSRRPKALNLSTYKVHALGDYVATIRDYGTTDSYSTELVCVLHFFLIVFY
jgi:hypothetical protein